MEGLPRHVAVASVACGGDGESQAGWDVRVKSFEMKKTSIDRSVFYTATRPTVRVTINPKNATVATVRADRVYDGTDVAVLGEMTLNGIIEGDDVTLNKVSGGGTFADPAPGVSKPVTLASDLELAGSGKADYTLTNPQPTVVGTITKASAVLAMSVAPASVLMSQGTQPEITTTVTDLRTGAVQSGAANPAAVVLTSDTPAVCDVSGTTITAKAAGTCRILGRQASSANYNAATAASDPAGTTETVEVQVFAAPQTISVIADDLVVAQGESVDPTVQLTGLFDGDEIADVEYDYFQGVTPLPGAPTDPGTYKVVPRSGSLTAANPGAYDNAGAFRYVTGSLVITPVPPTITKMSPAIGDLAGGTKVTITGTLLDSVTSVRFGDKTYRAPEFTVNEDGTQLTFTTPPAGAPASVPVTLVAGTAEAAETFSYVDAPVVVDPTPSPTPTVLPTTVPVGDITPGPSPSATPSPSPSTSPTPGPTPTPSAPPTASPVPTTVPTAPTVAPTTDDNVRLKLALELEVNAPLAGAQASLSGGGLKAGSTYVLTMNSTPVQVATGTTDGRGDFTATITMPKKACVSGGLHELVLSGTAPSGRTVEDSSFIVLNDTCTVKSVVAVAPVDDTLQLGSFIFPYQSAKLRPNAKKALRELAGSLNGATLVTITGYTQTELTSKAAKQANRRLALKRAKAVRKYLRSLGVKVPITVVGAGGVNPVDKKNQKRNRRVTIIVKF